MKPYAVPSRLTPDEFENVEEVKEDPEEEADNLDDDPAEMAMTVSMDEDDIKSEPDIDEDPIESLEDLHARLSEELLPDGFTLLRHPKLSLAKIAVSEERGLDVVASVEIEADFTFKMYYNHVRLKNSSVPDHCLKKGSAGKIMDARDVIAVAEYVSSCKVARCLSIIKVDPKKEKKDPLK